ncbi:ATP-binding protein [Kitasatospora sp. NPDC096147]|uniref:ATP-binding protein n=1 Tax=Kitasatospora sp. NPDC096147 TaxID=3364093 RepID=UPI003801D185
MAVGAERTALYEREAETGAAEEAVRALGAGRDGAGTGGLLVFVGQAGLGKTALVTEVRRLAVWAGCTVLFARGGERRRHEPFHVVRQLLQPVLAGLGEEGQRQVTGRWHGIVGPAVGLLPPTGALDPQGVRDGLDYVLVRLARLLEPLVVVVDDLHWSDPESLGWLAAFAERARELPVLLVLACRPGFDRTSTDPTFTDPTSADPTGSAPATLPGPLPDTFDQPDRPGPTGLTGPADQPDRGPESLRRIHGLADRVHRLRPLQPDSVAGLVRASLGPEAEEGFCRQVWTVTGGSPFGTSALLREVGDQQLEPVEGNTEQLRELAAKALGLTRDHWLGRLGPSTLGYAWAASLLGTDIRPELAAAIAAQGPDAAARSLRELRHHRVLIGTADGRLEFVHPLIATSVYQSVPPAVRTAMHGIAATEVENAGLGLAAASRHLLETRPDGDEETVRKLRRAAAEHLATGAPEAAQRCLRRALSEPPDDRDRAEVLYELGCSALLTDPATTVNQLRLALDALDEQPGLAPGERRVDATFRLAQALAHSNRLREAAEVCAEEAARTPSGPGRGRLEVAHFMFSAFQAEEPDSRDRFRRLERYARSLAGPDGTAAAVSVLRCWELVLRGGTADEAIALAEWVLEEGRLPPELGWTNTTWGFELPGVLGIGYLYADRVDRAEALFDEAVTAYQVAGWSGGHLGFALFLKGLLRFRCGALAEAEELLRHSLRTAERIAPGIPLQWFAVGVLADTLLARGRPEEAWELAQHYSFGPPFPTVMVLPDAPTLYGRLLLARGDAAGAAEALATAGAALDERGWHNPVWAPWTGHLALALLTQDPPRARELAEESVRRAERFGPASAVGSALRLAAAVHDGPPATALLERAVERLAASPNRYEHALALVELGESLTTDGRPDEAGTRLSEGRKLAVHCGADGLAERAGTALAALAGPEGPEGPEGPTDTA